MKKLLGLFSLILLSACAGKVKVSEITNENWELLRKQYEVRCEKNSSIQECLFKLEQYCGKQNFSLFPIDQKYYKVTKPTSDIIYIGSCVKEKDKESRPKLSL